jgi:hypothetical protein
MDKENVICIHDIILFNLKFQKILFLVATVMNLEDIILIKWTGECMITLTWNLGKVNSQKQRMGVTRGRRVWVIQEVGNGYKISVKQEK